MLQRFNLYDGGSMVKVFTKKEENENIRETETALDKAEKSNELLAVLQNLQNEETALNEEKQNLMVLKGSLQNKVKDEIEQKQKSIQKLKFEISDLKNSCEDLTKLLNTGIMAR
jgi:DNA repair exonuclease SbcCD ATPase subunit